LLTLEGEEVKIPAHILEKYKKWIIQLCINCGYVGVCLIFNLGFPEPTLIYAIYFIPLVLLRLCILVFIIGISMFAVKKSTDTYEDFIELKKSLKFLICNVIFSYGMIGIYTFIIFL
jgi:hypothetical protein